MEKKENFENVYLTRVSQRIGLPASEKLLHSNGVNGEDVPVFSSISKELGNKRKSRGQNPWIFIFHGVLKDYFHWFGIKNLIDKHLETFDHIFFLKNELQIIRSVKLALKTASDILFSAAHYMIKPFSG